MPAEGVPLQPNDKILTNNEIYYLARIFVEQGVRKIRLTGGEPTVRKDIVEIIGKLNIFPWPQFVFVLLLIGLLVYLC